MPLGGGIRPGLTKPAASGELKEEYVAICRDLLTTLTPLEPYWAYPGMPQFSRVSRLFPRAATTSSPTRYRRSSGH